MVDKVSVNPLSVRGAGDIVSPKTVSDFDVYNSTIVSSSEDVDGAVMTVYTVSYVSGTYFTVSSDNIVPVGESSFIVSAVLKKNSDDSAVSGASVSCTVNGETVLTGTTDSNGSVSFTIPTMEDVSKYTVKLVYSGTENVGGAFKVTGLICVDLTTLALALTGNKTIIQTNDSCALIATLTGTGVDGETIGIPGQTVSFYETYTPYLDVSVNPVVIQSGETATATVQLKDADDGSLVRESGLTIGLYEELPAVVPPLDGTDTVVSWSTMDNLTSDGVFRSHGSYLSEGWDNTDFWKLSFDYRYVMGTSPAATKYVGLMPICSSEINPFTDEKRADYAIACWEGSVWFNGLGFTSWEVSPENVSIDQTVWNHYEFTKLSATRLKIVLNNTYTWIGEFPNLAELETLHIGTRDNPSDRNYGGYVEYRNIRID